MIKLLITLHPVTRWCKENLQIQLCSRLLIWSPGCWARTRCPWTTGTCLRPSQDTGSSLSGRNPSTGPDHRAGGACRQWRRRRTAATLRSLECLMVQSVSVVTWIYECATAPGVWQQAAGDATWCYVCFQFLFILNCRVARSKCFPVCLHGNPEEGWSVWTWLLFGGIY